MSLLVIKFGGSAFHPDALAPFAARIHALRQEGHRVVVVHGGGKEITRHLDQLGIQAAFRDGLRVTDDPTLDATERVLSGTVNKALARALHAGGVPAVGIAGTDAGLLTATPLVLQSTDAAGRVHAQSLGHVGQVERADASLLHVLLDAGYVPVVSPLAQGGPRGVLNVNADTAAAALAGALPADEFLLLTDVPGVRVDDGIVAPALTAAAVEQLKNKGTIHGGMLPKVDACLAALHQGAGATRIQHLDDFIQASTTLGTRIHQG